MTENQIRDGYEQLESTLAPPLDAQARVTRRMRVRRARQRVAIAGGTVVGLAALAATVVVGLGGSGEDPDRLVAVDPPAEQSELVLTRPDGSTYDFTDLTVSCDPPAGFGDELPPTPDTVWLTSPFELVDDGNDEVTEDDRLVRPFLLMEVDLNKVNSGQSFTLPVDGPGNSESYPMTLFVGDPEGAADGNEVVSSESDSSGTVRVVRASCDPEPVLELVVDATLGSEEQKQPLDLAGTVR